MVTIKESDGVHIYAEYPVDAKGTIYAETYVDGCADLYGRPRSLWTNYLEDAGYSAVTNIADITIRPRSVKLLVVECGRPSYRERSRTVSVSLRTGRIFHRTRATQTGANCA